MIKLIDILKEIRVNQPLRFTGYKDENGRNIIEGDIYDVGQTINGVSKFVVTIKNNKPFFYYYWENEKKLGGPYDYDFKGLWDLIQNKNGTENIKYIGNLYGK